MKYQQILAGLVPATALLLSFAPSAAKAEIVLVDQNNWKLTTQGFVEMDIFNDSTRSYREIEGNNPVARTDAAGKGDGLHGRTQYSMRNSRLAFGLAAPSSENWKTRGYYEMDFQGFDPAPGATNSESAFYGNGGLRTRHLYAETVSTSGWKLLAGQTWDLMGWQPYYFMTTASVAPIAGMTYNRVIQVRATKQFQLASTVGMEAAIAALRPPQADGQMPDLQARVRWTLDNYTSGFTGSASGARKVMPASVGVSGAFRSIAMPSSTGTVDRFGGGAVALNAMVPIIPSSDNKSVSNTLSLLAEFTTGTGYGDQFNGWTGNTANPLNQATTGQTKTVLATNGSNLDGGIGDYDSTGAFHLIQLQTFNVHAQYHLPNELPFWMDIGYGQLAAGNMGAVTTNNVGSNGKIAYNRDRTAFFNTFYQATDNLRTGLEYIYTDTRYVDNASARNHRFQVTGLFQF